MVVVIFGHDIRIPNNETEYEINKFVYKIIKSMLKTHAACNSSLSFLSSCRCSLQVNCLSNLDSCRLLIVDSWNPRSLMDLERPWRRHYKII